MDRATLAVLALAAASCAEPPPPAVRAPPPPVSAAPPPPACAAEAPKVCDELGAAALAGGDRAGARRLFETGCNAHHGPACTHLAELARADKDDPEATKRFDEACTAGDPRGCAELARAYDGARGTWRNLEEARNVAQKACDAGETSVCALVGEWVARGIAGPRDDARAVQLFTRGCASDPLACVRLAHLEREGLGTPADPARAASRYQAACDAEVAEGCHWLASAVEAGVGVAQDAERAISLRRAACALGHAGSCAVFQRTAACRMGLSDACHAIAAYAAGGSDTIAADPARSKALFQSAFQRFEQTCAAHHPAGCTGAGAMKERGEGERADPAAARKLYHRACERGHLPGCTAEGSLLARSLGGARNASGALKLFEKACAAGDGEGCLELAHLAAKGDGVAQDPLFGLSHLLAGCRASSPSGQACSEAASLLEMARRGCGLRPAACKRSEQMNALAQGQAPGARAAEILRKVCNWNNWGDGRACAQLGGVQMGGGADLAEALGTFTKACDLGDPSGCAAVGTMLTSVFSTGLPHDPARAAGLLSRACDAGVMSACGDLGTLITDSGKDAARGRALLERACDAGDGRACFYAASFGGADAKARAALEAKGRQAFDAACAHAPWSCRTAAEHTTDAAAAKQKNTIACEWGVTHACAAIGAYFFKPSPPPLR